MHTPFLSRKILLSLTTLLVVAGLSVAACSSTSSAKTCTTDEVKKCDDQLNTCLATAPSNDATSPGFQACADDCKKKNCDCQTACGNTCTQS